MDHQQDNRAFPYYLVGLLVRRAPNPSAAVLATICHARASRPDTIGENIAEEP